MKLKDLLIGTILMVIVLFLMRTKGHPCEFLTWNLDSTEYYQRGQIISVYPNGQDYGKICQMLIDRGDFIVYYYPDMTIEQGNQYQGKNISEVISQ
jgi:hypothetical protein